MNTIGFVMTEIFDSKIFALQNQLTVVNFSQPLTSYSVYMTVEAPISIPPPPCPLRGSEEFS